MSRIGKKPILIPTGVEVRVDGDAVTVKGPKGQLTWAGNPLTKVALGEEDGAKVVQISVAQPDDTHERAMWGTARATIANMVEGVVNGFTKTLEINGVGFRANAAGKKLVLSLGFSHDIDFDLPEGITATVDKNVVTVTGIDRQMVGEIAARLRSLKKPEPYLGKGIKYTDETIRRKAGKAAKSAE